MKMFLEKRMICLTILLIGLAIGFFVLFSGAQTQKVYVPYPTASAQRPINRMYYDSLAKQCKTKGSVSCCLASVSRMRKGGFLEAFSSACPDGFRLQQLKCIDSLQWCEPLKQ